MKNLQPRCFYLCSYKNYTTTENFVFHGVIIIHEAFPDPFYLSQTISTFRVAFSSSLHLNFAGGPCPIDWRGFLLVGNPPISQYQYQYRQYLSRPFVGSRNLPDNLLKAWAMEECSDRIWLCSSICRCAWGRRLTRSQSHTIAAIAV